jgi:NhaP-type Na+/H+ or K+/H+ antiporter
VNTQTAIAGGVGALLGVFVGHAVGKALTRGKDPATEILSTAIGAVAASALAAGMFSPAATAPQLPQSTTPPA